MLLNHPIISSRYFFPRRAPLNDATMVDAADGSRLACYRRSHNESSRTIVHFHGNGEIVRDYIGPIEGAFAATGCNLFFSEYRGYGASTGIPALAGMLDDVEQIHSSLDIEDEEVIVFGRSVGSLYAIEFAHQHPKVAGLVIESGIADVLERLLLRMTPQELGCSKKELEDAVNKVFDHEMKMSKLTSPLLVMHASGDILVDPSHGQRLFEWSGSIEKNLHIFDRGDHNSIMMVNWQEYWEVVGNFVSMVGQR